MTHELKPIRTMAEKLSALRTEDYFKERAARVNVAQALEILNRAGAGNPPVKGDEYPSPLGGEGGGVAVG